MKIARTRVEKHASSVSLLEIERADTNELTNDSREIMRHSDGSIHAALIETTDARPSLSLYGAKSANDPLVKLFGPVASSDSDGELNPATDSNQNGVYVAYVERRGGGSVGSLVHVPDIFGAPETFEIHTPLTPEAGAVTNSFVQASRGYNSVIYGWRDTATGAVYVGVSKDGKSFPPAKALVQDEALVNGPAVGIFGDLAFVVYETSDPRFAPKGHETGGHFFVFLESGDGGQTWSEPAPLVDHVNDLPTAVLYGLEAGGEPVRSEIQLSGASRKVSSLQSLMWLDPENADKRAFTLSTFAPLDGQPSAGAVGVLSWKPARIGGGWKHVLTNADLFQAADDSVVPTSSTQYKYCALPGTPVRVIAYVQKATDGAKGGDRLVLISSTNMGDSFDYESKFSPEDLSLPADAQLLISNSACTHVDEAGALWQDLLVGDASQEGKLYHALLPVGISVSGLDPTKSW